MRTFPIKSASLFVIGILLSYLSSPFSGEFYGAVFPGTLGSFVEGSALAGLVPSYVFFLPLLLIGFGTNKKHWWAAVLLLPAVAFVMYFDLAHFWFYLLLAAVGWAIGFGISKLLSRLRTKGPGASI